MNDGDCNNYRERARSELKKKLDEFVENLGLSNETAAVSSFAENTSGKALRKPIITEQSDTRSGSLSSVHAGHRKRLRDSVKRDLELESFSDVEILEILLSFVIPQRDTNVIAHKLLDKFRSLLGVMTAKPAELFDVYGMTRSAAMLLPALWHVCSSENRLDIVLQTRQDAVNLFDALYLGGLEDGMWMAFFDINCRLLAVEHVDVSPHVSYRAAVVSSVKYGARGVLLVWCGHNSIGIGCDAVEYVRNMAAVLDTAGVALLDFIMLTDYGYYTSGPRVGDYGGWFPQYVFIPSAPMFVRCAYLKLRMIRRKKN